MRAALEGQRNCNVSESQPLAYLVKCINKIMTKYTFKRVSKRKSQCRSWLIWYPQHRKPQKSLLQLIKSVKQTTNNVLGFCATKLFKKFFYFHLVFVLTNETSQLHQILLNLFKFPQTSLVLMEFP